LRLPLALAGKALKVAGIGRFALGNHGEKVSVGLESKLADSDVHAAICEDGRKSTC
jgi:hypothetical protein